MTAARVVRMLLLGGWAAGCAHGAPPGGDPVVPIADSTSPAPEPATRRAVPTGTCTLRAEAWSPRSEDDGAPLIVAGRGYFHVHAASLELKLSSTISADAIPAQIANQGVRLRGTFSSQHLALYLRKPVVFEEVVVPTADARLSWSGIGDRGIVVTHDLVGGIEADRLRATVPCRDLSLTREPFDMPSDLYPRDRGRSARLRSDRRIPLSTSAGGAPVMWLDLSRWDAEGWGEIVRELAFDGTHSRIAWQRERELVIGWIPGDALLGEEDPYDGDGGGGFGLVGALMGSAVGEAPDARRRCKQPIDLSASIEGGPRHVVGTLEPETPFEVIDDATDEQSHASIWVSDVFDVALIPQPGVEIWVHREALARCR